MLDETCNLTGLITAFGGVGSATHNISDLELVSTDRGTARSGERTVAHVFDLATHEDDERAVRESLHESLPPGLVLAGRNAGSELISFDWENKSERVGKWRETADGDGGARQRRAGQTLQVLSPPSTISGWRSGTCEDELPGAFIWLPSLPRLLSPPSPPPAPFMPSTLSRPTSLSTQTS